jgi:hypothetical protein
MTPRFSGEKILLDLKEKTIGLNGMRLGLRFSRNHSAQSLRLWGM